MISGHRAVDFAGRFNVGAVCIPMWQHDLKEIWDFTKNPGEGLEAVKW
jgi:hypothetical protein